MELTDELMGRYMQSCIALAQQAQRGMRKPLVGAIVLDNQGKIVGRGYKKFLRGTSMVQHAERVALDDVYCDEPKTLITTLEPCYLVRKKQIFSSCSQLIVERGVDTVVCALMDEGGVFSPGRGFQHVVENGVTLIRYEELNRDIRKYLL